MKTGVEINGIMEELDLTRVSVTNQLHVGDEVLTRDPRTGRFCRAIVVVVGNVVIILNNSICRAEAKSWQVAKSELSSQVYKIINTDKS